MKLREHGYNALMEILPLGGISLQGHSKTGFIMVISECLITYSTTLIDSS